MNKIEIVNVEESFMAKRAVKKSQNAGVAFVGKDILELISVSMYVEPLTLYREYIQNATDGIDQAVANGVLDESGKGEIKVKISQSTRCVTISDNGQGIPAKKFSRIMLSFGASEKRGTEARGFRGVGRFSGLGYCQELVFRSKSAFESVVSEVVWDGRLLKQLLADNAEQLSIAELVKRVAIFSQYESDDPEAHFFEVEIKSVARMGTDILLNEEKVKRYISQVCPVPYSRDFGFKRQLEKLLTERGIVSGYSIRIEDDYSDSALVHRPYSDEFYLTESESDSITAVDVFEIEGVHGGVAAVGWIFQHSYKGIVPSGSNIRGIRVRVGNTQVGEESLMAEAFPEPRFNSWSIGEIHILEKKITPNGRRDSFDNNIHWMDLQNQFAQHAKNIAKVCRKNSSERNAIKQFNSEIQKADQFISVLGSGVLSKRKSAEIKESIAESVLRAENLSSASQLSEGVRAELSSVVRKYREKSAPERIGAAQSHDIYDLIPKSKVASVKEVFDFIFECSPNKIVAQSLINKIVDQYKIKYN